MIVECLYIISSKTKQTFCLWLHPLVMKNKIKNSYVLTNSDLTKFSFSIQAFVDKGDIMIHGSDICLRHLLLTDNILVKTKSRLAENQINIGGWEIFGKTSLNFRV